MRTLFTLLATLIFAQPALATGDLSRQDPVTITVELGSKNGAMVFQPSDLTFETGKLYKLVLVNNSPHEHYFSSDQFVRSIFTRKVQTFAPDGDRTAEIKGHIRELEVFPGHKAEWWFVPIQTGEFEDLKCTKDGHAEAGMTGTITIH